MILGADHELGIFDSKGRSVPAHRRGFRHKTLPMTGVNGALIRDGWNVEFNPHPATCREVLASSLVRLMANASRLLRQGEGFRAVPAYIIDMADLEGAPEDVLLSGCDKSWNAYTEEQTAPDVDLSATEIRCAGGHMHISAGTSTYGANQYQWATEKETTFQFIKLCDRVIGLTSTYLFGSELAGLRRRFYGKAGEFRFQNHQNSVGALEYRTPGPEMFASIPMISLHFGMFRYLYSNFKIIMRQYSPKYEDQVREIINKGESDPSLLDVIPEFPYYYNKDLLKKARERYLKTAHTPLDPFRMGHGHLGWDTWVQQTDPGFTKLMYQARNAATSGPKF